MGFLDFVYIYGDFVFVSFSYFWTLMLLFPFSSYLFLCWFRSLSLLIQSSHRQKIAETLKIIIIGTVGSSHLVMPCLNCATALFLYAYQVQWCFITFVCSFVD